MGSGATKREILEKKLEQRLQDPKTEPLISLPLDFLEDITCGFSTERELGKGACGVVYKGVLRSGKAIAVKKIFNDHLLGDQVENEIICLKEVRHQNIVLLVGYCVDTKLEVVEQSGKRVMAEIRACFLCFEFLCNGSLEKHLYDDTSVLDWDKRYKIIRGVCRGLHYLHDKHRIVHRDLKPQNILVDDMMMPKICDFGLSRLLNQDKSRTVTAKLRGTPGYMAPEYIEQRSISFEADIFSLGVIIIEIITGCKGYPSERTETSLKEYIDEVVGSWRNRIPIHMSSEMDIQQVEKCITKALMCLEPESKKRPSSLDIVQGLDALELKSGSPGNSPSDPEEDRRPQNLRSQVNMNIINIPKTISAIDGLNECANLFQWVTSAISSLTSRSNDTQKERIQQRDISQLHSDLQCLTDTLPAKYNLINRAEWRIHDPYVADLLSRLKDAVYDAEDLVDEFRWYETKVSVEGNVFAVEPVIDFFHSVTQGSFNKVISIQKRLNNVSEQLEKQGLLLESPKFDKSSRPETSFFSTEEKIMGRDDEKKKLIMLLGVSSRRKRKISGVSSTTSNQVYPTIDSNEATIVNFQVLPIVGIGGVGKTTLAQDICSHSKVKGHFDLIIWICVSDDFNVSRLTKEAIEQTSKKLLENGNLTSLTSLQCALEKSMKKKRFLIVLDDIWDAKEEHWKQFCAPFKIALQGSMMLVTTRSQKVADVVGTMDPFPLEGLKEDVFRRFFEFCVFGRNSSNIDSELEQIGKKILPKLRGSPLAAKTLGRLLGMSLEQEHWNMILKSQLWELEQKETDILPALRLSYMYLPLYLKRCFSFCAVYPKDYVFKKEDLVEIWVAEGLVKHRPNISLHETGGQYFEELAHLSFFQKYPQTHKKYVIHDLMHDMAQLVSKDECFIVKEKKDLRKIPENVRHLSVLKGEDVHCSDLLEHDMAQHRKLRTLFCHLSLKSEIDNTVMEKWCNELLCMRVMVCSVSKWGLPGSISNMKLLRYLQILNSSLCKSLPSTFCCLSNMQIFYAKKWKIDCIPSGFVKLINLQKFESEQFQFYDIHSLAGKEKRRLELKKYIGKSRPHGFDAQILANITSLVIGYWCNINFTFRSLTDVEIVSCQNLSSLERFLQPAYVPMIRKIEISDCRSLELVPAERFGDLRFLEVLKVKFCPMIKSQRLFAPSLKECHLCASGNLGGNIDCTSLTNLQLSACPLESIELQMWNLPSLQKLQIRQCRSLTIIKDSEPISLDLSLCRTRSRMVRFPFLTHLTIQLCFRLETSDGLLHLLANNRSEGFPRLKNLEILRCERLNWQSGVLLPSSLQCLTLMRCGDFSAGFTSCLEKLTSLRSLMISSKFIVSIPGHLWNGNLKSLRKLMLIDCPNLKSIGGPDETAHIRDLDICICPELKEIPRHKRKAR